MNHILRVKNLCYSVQVKHGILNKYQNSSILKDISFSLKDGEILGIVGETGSGKSTLAKILAGIIDKTSGEIVFDQNILNPHSKVNPVQILFQNNGEILNPLRVVENLVNEVILLSNGEESYKNDDILRIFNSLNIPLEIMHNKSYQLSGGQRQRVALARLLSVHPKLLILDEPFSAQDIESQLNLVRLLRSVNEESFLSMICISHNLRLFKDFAHRIVVLYNGRIVEEGSAEQIFNDPQHPYTKFLFKADRYELALSDFNSVFA